jgi:hypothetical protein
MRFGERRLPHLLSIKEQGYISKIKHALTKQKVPLSTDV